VPEERAHEADAILSQAAQPVGADPPLPYTGSSVAPDSVSGPDDAVCPRCGGSEVPIHARFHRLATALAVAGFPLMSALKRRRCRLCGCVFPAHRRA
jgi:rubredoxin